MNKNRFGSQADQSSFINSLNGSNSQLASAEVTQPTKEREKL
jgi:hypothetical protein